MCGSACGHPTPVVPRRFDRGRGPGPGGRRASGDRCHSAEAATVDRATRECAGIPGGDRAGQGHHRRRGAITVDEAFDRLRRHARRHRTSVHEVAGAVVDGHLHMTPAPPGQAPR
ncbi:ANTAR domain-containing protein [Rhodococcus jostii]|uniref:ANTAR domain-containing protein n=1 Tax=Rhodococcus jostii TaxID=132919 RepID=UPI003668FF5E